MQAEALKAPFPYTGGKYYAAEKVWQLLGDPDYYIEPFCGSAAVLLARPTPPKTETITDADGFITNFWRSIAKDPEAVAYYADWPVNHIDLTARHLWLVEQRTGLVEKLRYDPEFYDAKIAGWWCWAKCIWIGSGGFCTGTGAWIRVDGRLVKRSELKQTAQPTDCDADQALGVNNKLPHISNQGQGINRVLPGVDNQLPHLGDKGKGINRVLQDSENCLGVDNQLPHIGHKGMGINRVLTDPEEYLGVDNQLPHLGDRGQKLNRILPSQHTRTQFILNWFQQLHTRLRDVRVICADWSKPLNLNILKRFSSVGIFLDPPYAEGDYDYGVFSRETEKQVRDWCIEHGSNPKLRIVLAGYKSAHLELLDHGWQPIAWPKQTGYTRYDEAKQRAADEVLWASPHTIPMKTHHTLFEL